MNREEHLLTQLAEECAEVAQRASKAARFGMFETQPGQPLSNRMRIREEIVDLIAVVEMLDPNLLCYTQQEIDTKKAKVEKYLRYAQSLDKLT